MIESRIGRRRGGAGRALCLAAALGFGLAGLACEDAPTATDGISQTDALYKKPGGQPGGSTTLEFLATLSGVSSPDFVAGSQPVSGGLRRTSLKASGPYTFTVQFDAADLATCEDGGARLAALLGTHSGTVEVNVDRRSLTNDPTYGVVVNFETTLGGHDYFLTTGRGMNELIEGSGGATVSKTAGFIRIVEDGDLGVWCPERNGFDGTNGMVDFEFVFAE
jgi:hypothetical protein